MNYKIITITTLFIFAFYFAIGQPFNKLVEGLQAGLKRGGYITELSNQNILLTTDIFQTEVVMLNKDAMITHKTYLDCHVTGIYELSPDSILMIAWRNPIDTTKSILLALLLNRNLEIISSDTIIINFPVFWTARLLYHNNQVYYFGAFNSWPISSTDSRITAGTIDKKGKFSIRTDFTISYSKVHIQKHPNGDVILLSGAGVLYFWDKDFNYKGYHVIQGSDLVDHVDSFWSNDTCFIMAGTALVDNKGKLGTTILNKEFDAQKNKVYNSEYTYNFAGIFSSIVPISDGFYFAGTKNVSQIAFPIDTTTSTIQVIKSDNKLNTIWEKQLGGDASYVVYSVAPSHDEGLLILASRWDSIQNGFDSNDIFLIKMNANGEYTQIRISTSQTQEIEIYPNPGDNIINIRGIEKLYGSQFQLYSLTGKQIYSIEIVNSYLDLKEIPSGMYIYKIVNENQIRFSGKWIKK